MFPHLAVVACLQDPHSQAGPCMSFVSTPAVGPVLFGILITKLVTKVWSSQSNAKLQLKVKHTLATTCECKTGKFFFIEDVFNADDVDTDTLKRHGLRFHR